MANRPLRLIFAGTPEFAAIHLEALVDSKHQLTAVYTQPDRPAGRGRKVVPGPVKALALKAGLPVLQPATLRDVAAQQQLEELGADAMVVVAYGLILPQPVLDAPRLGCLNVHASLLPRWRGAAPIQRAIEAGDEETGITVMQMDAGLDTGDMLARARCPIGADTTAASLHDTLAQLGAPLLLEVLADLPAYQRRAEPQDERLATYAGKILKPEAGVDWRDDAQHIDRKIRAFNPFPVCFSTLGDTRVKLWEARAAKGGSLQEPPGTILRADRHGILVNCGRGQLNLLRLQLPGGVPLAAEQLLAAHRALFSPGQQFRPAPEAGR